MFESEEMFCSQIFDVFANSVELINEKLADYLRKQQNTIGNYNILSREISKLIKEMHKDAVLLIDEVDKSSNSRIFLKFLGLLRNKYLARNSGEDIIFQSVILSGVHDIRNLKLAIRDESDSRFNSPWNISEDFSVDMSFSPDEIETMLTEYIKDKKVEFDSKIIAKEIYKYTNGYPYLVSRICKTIDECLGKRWDMAGVQEAVKTTLNEKSTLIEDVIKSILWSLKYVSFLRCCIFYI